MHVCLVWGMPYTHMHVYIVWAIPYAHMHVYMVWGVPYAHMLVYIVWGMSHAHMHVYIVWGMPYAHMLVYLVWGMPYAHMWRSEDHYGVSSLFPPHCGFQGWNSASTFPTEPSCWPTRYLLLPFIWSIDLGGADQCHRVRKEIRGTQPRKWKNKSSTSTCSFMWKSSGVHQKVARNNSILDAIDHSTEIQCLLHAINR